MKPTDAFGVIVRTLGFLIILEVLWRVLVSLETVLIPPYATGPEGIAWTLAFLVTQFLVLLVGCGCFFRADVVVRWSYRDTGPGRESN